MPSERPIPDLSPREQQLLELAAEGLTDMAIAQRLGISEATVGTYWGRVRIKFGPFSRTELVAILLRSEREAIIDELRKENETLSKELASLGNSLLALPYREFLAHAPDAMIVMSRSGTVTFANLAAEEMFGYGHRELESLNHTDLIPDRFRVTHDHCVASYFENPGRFDMGAHVETPAIMKDGSEFSIRATLSSLTTPDEELVICAIRSR